MQFVHLLIFRFFCESVFHFNLNNTQVCGFVHKSVFSTESPSRARLAYWSRKMNLEDSIPTFAISVPNLCSRTQKSPNLWATYDFAAFRMKRKPNRWRNTHNIWEKSLKPNTTVLRSLHSEKRSLPVDLRHRVAPAHIQTTGPTKECTKLCRNTLVEIPLEAPVQRNIPFC